MIPALNAIFGNKTAAAVLLFIENYESAYAKKIADIMDLNLSSVQEQLRKFEDAGVLVSRTIGRTRVFEFNPRNPTAKKLRNFLREELEILPDSMVYEYFRERTRPRRTGKPLRRLAPS